MATAKKLPSGSWRVQVFSHTDSTGRKVRKSFTCDDPSPRGKRKCEAMAAAWAAEKEIDQSSNMTFEQAAKEYIANRTAICSPRTIEEYTGYLDRHLSGLLPIHIDNITPAHLQKIVNTLAVDHKPKTVRNVYGLVASVLHVYRPGLPTIVKMPAPKAAELYIPTDAEIKQIIQASAGTTLELPILLAAFGPMRRGEICALRAENIDGSTVHVCENMVKKKVNGKKTWVVKVPKTPAGHRYIEYPNFVREVWEKSGLVQICPDTITKAFGILLDDLGIPHFRFHDLRHYSASIQHALGIPDAYIMQRGGWSSDRVLKTVYRHAMSDQTAKMTRIANEYFEKIGSHESSHDIEKQPADAG